MLISLWMRILHPQASHWGWRSSGGPTDAVRMWTSLNESVRFRKAPTPFMMGSPQQRGVSRYAVGTKGRYIQIFRGVWIDVEDETEIPAPLWADEDWLVTLVRLRGLRLLHPGVAGSHATAAQLYGLPMPHRLRDKAIHVSSGSRGLKIERPGVILHRSMFHEADDIPLLELPLVSIPLLVVQLAPSLSTEELVQLGDAAIGRQAGGPYIGIEELSTRILERPRVTERRRIERALSLMRPTVESPRETWLRLRLIGEGFPEPAVHPPLRSTIGDCLLHPDLGYPDLRIAIEYEGDQHRTSEARFAADIRRRELMEAEGWIVLRVTKRTDMTAFARTLAAHLGRRGASI